MDINLSISAASSIISNYLVVAIYESTSPNLAVDFQAFAAPHTADRNITFINASPVVHIVRIFENATATVGGTQRHDFIYNPEYTNVQIRDDLFLFGGITPGFAVGSNIYKDATLDGWDYRLKIRQSYDNLQPGVEWQKLSAPDIGFEVLMNYTFQPEEVWILEFQPKVTIVTPLASSNTTNLFNSVRVIDADTSLTAADMSTCVIISGSNPHHTITLPDLDTILANRLLFIESQGGSHVNATLACFGAQSIDWLDGSLSELVIAQSEELAFYKWVDPQTPSIRHWRVKFPEGNFKSVGWIMHTYDADAKNTLFCAGQEVSRTTYKRLWKYVQSLDSSAIVSDADWNKASLNNKGKFSTGDGLTTFRLPLLYTPGFLRAVDGTTRKAGEFQAQDVKITYTDTRGNDGTTATLIGYAGGNPSVYQFKRTQVSQGTETRPDSTGVYLRILF